MPFSLIQTDTDGECVKPSALAVMEAPQQLAGPAGKWSLVASVTGSFYQRSVFRFSPLRARAVRATVQEANYGGYASGAVPSLCPNSTPLTSSTGTEAARADTVPK